MNCSTDMPRGLARKGVSQKGDRKIQAPTVKNIRLDSRGKCAYAMQAFAKVSFFLRSF